MFISEGVYIQCSQNTNTVFVYYLFSVNKSQYINNLWIYSPSRSLEKSDRDIQRQLERHNNFFFQKTLYHQAHCKQYDVWDSWSQILDLRSYVEWRYRRYRLEETNQKWLLNVLNSPDLRWGSCLQNSIALQRTAYGLDRLFSFSLALQWIWQSHR